MKTWMLVLTVLVGLFVAAPARAEDKVSVKVGASADAAQDAKASDLSVDALKAARKAKKKKTTFTLTGPKGAKHTLELSAKEAGDILDGTTVTAQTAAGGPKVWIALVKEKAAVEKGAVEKGPAPAPAEPAGGSGW